MPQAGIDIASGTGSTTLITTAAGEHFKVNAITLIPSDTGELELLSGATVIWHVQVGVAGGLTQGLRGGSLRPCSDGPVDRLGGRGL